MSDQKEDNITIHKKYFNTILLKYFFILTKYLFIISFLCYNNLGKRISSY